jgi:hypothetical protein
MRHEPTRERLTSNVPNPPSVATAQDNPAFWTKRAQDLNQQRRAV